MTGFTSNRIQVFGFDTFIKIKMIGIDLNRHPHHVDVYKRQTQYKAVQYIHFKVQAMDNQCSFFLRKQRE